MRRGHWDVFVLLRLSTIYLTPFVIVADDISQLRPEGNSELVDDSDGCSLLHLTSALSLLSRQPSSSQVSVSSSHTHQAIEKSLPLPPRYARILDTQGHDMLPADWPNRSEREMKNSGSDIWNKSKSWSTIRRWHPAGVISNVYEGPIRWANVGYFDVYMLVFLSLAAYPAMLISGLLTMTILVSMCITQSRDEKDGKLTHTFLPGVDVDTTRTPSELSHCEPDPEVPCSDSSECDPEFADSRVPLKLCLEPVANSSQETGPTASVANLTAPATDLQDEACFPSFLNDYAPPVVSLDSLTPWSLSIYTAYTYFCCAIPSLMVFGLPIIMMIFSYPHPQEVNSILGLITSAFVFSNGVYMLVFGCGALRVLERYMQIYSKEENKQGVSQSDPMLSGRRTSVKHWVLLPQYCEHVDVVAMAMKSISKASTARSSIGVVLAMEEREKEAETKVNTLKVLFEHSFNDILVTYHPDGLPNDPPGKASNCKWAYDCLVQHLRSTKQDPSTVILTVADADSEFHESYFEALTDQYLGNSPEIRNLRIYQAPVFHVKNYHRQPSPVSVGTMFTAMQQLSCLGDPHAVVMPYSTYSIPLELAWRVGGWDAEWIGEDWHMGIKCFLYTVGICSVQSINLPVINYTPEGDTWFRTLMARWSQAKRHALGFSDVAYYFMMLPLIFNYGFSKSGQNSGVHLRAFWGMAGSGVCVLVKMINAHVILGVMAFYTFLNILLRFLLVDLLSRDKHIWLLFDRTQSLFSCLAIATVILGTLATMMFVWAYRLLRDRIESDKGGIFVIFQHPLLHWLYGSMSFIVFGPFYFFFLGIAVWRAALKTMTDQSFEYEVAAKPVPI